MGNEKAELPHKRSHWHAGHRRSPRRGLRLRNDRMQHLRGADWTELGQNSGASYKIDCCGLRARSPPCLSAPPSKGLAGARVMKVEVMLFAGLRELAGSSR